MLRLGLGTSDLCRAEYSKSSDRVLDGHVSLFGRGLIDNRFELFKSCILIRFSGIEIQGTTLEWVFAAACDIDGIDAAVFEDKSGAAFYCAPLKTEFRTFDSDARIFSEYFDINKPYSRVPIRAHSIETIISKIIVEYNNSALQLYQKLKRFPPQFQLHR